MVAFALTLCTGGQMGEKMHKAVIFAALKNFKIVGFPAENDICVFFRPLRDPDPT